MACGLGAVSCCLEWVPAQFHVVKSERFGMLRGLRAREFWKKKAACGLRLLLLVSDFVVACGLVAVKFSVRVNYHCAIVTLTRNLC